MSDLSVGYVNVFVSDFSASLAFYRDVLGLTPNRIDEDWGYGSFSAGPISFAIAKANEPELLGRHTGIGFIVEDVDASYERLRAAGVEFEMEPTKQPWGGTLALFKDPDGNIFYLDPGHS